MNECDLGFDGLLFADIWRMCEEDGGEGYLGNLGIVCVLGRGVE